MRGGEQGLGVTSGMGRAIRRLAGSKAVFWVAALGMMAVVVYLTIAALQGGDSQNTTGFPAESLLPAATGTLPQNQAAAEPTEAASWVPMATQDPAVALGGAPPGPLPPPTATITPTRVRPPVRVAPVPTATAVPPADGGEAGNPPPPAPTNPPPPAPTNAPLPAPTATTLPPQPTLTPTITPEPLPTATAEPLLITICHKPNDNNRGQTMQVDATELPGHLGHGDTLGPCPGD